MMIEAEVIHGCSYWRADFMGDRILVLPSGMPSQTHCQCFLMRNAKNTIDSVLFLPKFSLSLDMREHWTDSG